VREYLETWQIVAILGFVLAQIIACGFWSMRIARKQGRDEVGWLFLGLLFGPLSLIALIALGKYSDDELGQ
jgi:hypothetical protein